jgi:hypothetical protein
MPRCSTLHRTSEVQVTECFSNLLFSTRTHFAVDSALLEEFSFPKPPVIVAAHIICKMVSHRSCTAVTVISRLQFAIQSAGWAAEAAGTASPRRLPARPARGLPARPARGGCWHGRPATAARKWIRKCLNSDLS